MAKQKMKRRGSQELRLFIFRFKCCKILIEKENNHEKTSIIQLEIDRNIQMLEYKIN